MENQKSLISANKHVLFLVGEKEGIEISQRERDALVDALQGNNKFAIVQGSVIMLSSIKIIKPVYTACKNCGGRKWVPGEIQTDGTVARLDCPICTKE